MTVKDVMNEPRPVPSIAKPWEDEFDRTITELGARTLHQMGGQECRARARTLLAHPVSDAESESRSTSIHLSEPGSSPEILSKVDEAPTCAAAFPYLLDQMLQVRRPNIRSVTVSNREKFPDLMALQNSNNLLEVPSDALQNLCLPLHETNLLQDMYKQWYLRQECILLNLFGLKLCKFINSVPKNPENDKAKSKFLTCFLNICFLYDRENNSVFPPNPNIRAIIDEALRSLGTWAKPLEGVSSQDRLNFIQTVNLLIKIINHKNGKEILVGKDLAAFLNTQAFDEGSFSQNVDLLQEYATFFHELTLATKTSLLAEVQHPEQLFGPLIRLCAELKTNLNDETIGKIKAHLDQCFNSISTEMCNINTKPKIISKSTIERNLRYNVLENCDYFLSSFQSIFESRIIASHSPEYVFFRTRMNRFLNNSFACPSDLPIHAEKALPSDEHSPILKFEKHFCSLIKPIEFICKKVIHDHDLIKFHDNLALFNDIQKKCHLISICKSQLFPLDYLPNKLVKIKKKLAEVPDKLRAFLKAHYNKLPPEEQKSVIQGIQGVCLQKSLFLLRVVMIMEDVEAILYNHEFHPVSNPIPKEIADVIILDGLQELVTEEPEQEPEVVVHPAAPAEVPMAAVVDEPCEEKPALAAAMPKPKAAPKKSEQKTPLAAPTKVYPPVPKELLHLKKTRLIIQMLKKYGFNERREGPHLGLADAHGRVVRIPRCGDQDTGTVRSMYEMATAPLRFLRPEERK